MAYAPNAARPRLPGAIGRAFLVTAVVWLGGCQAPVERTVVYDPRFGGSTSMDLYLPDASEPRPGVMLVHGGAWKYNHKEMYRSVGRRLARAGYVAASVEYRLVPDGVFPKAAQDVGCALAYLQNHADELGLDPSRVVAMGYSAGGHLVSLVATANDDPGIAPDCIEGTPRKPTGVISGAGPQDLADLADFRPVIDFMGGTLEELPDAYALASPVNHASPDDPPFLFVHGSHDSLVPHRQSTWMRDLLRAQGVEADLLYLRGSGHVLNPADDASELSVSLLTDSPEAWIAISDFLERTVGRP